MKKLSLDLDQLTVDSFDTAPGSPEQGTVFGEQCTCHTNCTCPGCPTCYHTCDQAQNTCWDTCNTCWASCNGSCYYTECGGNTYDAFTCDPTRGPYIGDCCPM